MAADEATARPLDRDAGRYPNCPVVEEVSFSTHQEITMQNRKQASGQSTKPASKPNASGRQGEKQKQMQQGHDADTDPSLTSESEFSQQSPGVGADERPQGKQQQ
jgi:hypothetical protein